MKEWPPKQTTTDKSIRVFVYEDGKATIEVTQAQQAAIDALTKRIHG